MTAAQDALVTSCRSLADEAIRTADVAVAEEAARTIMAKPIAMSDEEAAALTDAAKVCRLTASKLEDDLKSITRPLDDAKKAARSLAVPHIERFEAAVRMAKDAVLRWNDLKRRRADEERRQAEKVEREAADRRQKEQDEARSQAAAAGDPEPVFETPPPVDTYAPPESVQVKGEIAGMHEMRVLKISAENILRIAQTRPHLLELTSGAARIEFKAEAAKNGEAGAIESFRLDGIAVKFETVTVLK
jgi:hypothetical protein